MIGFNCGSFFFAHSRLSLVARSVMDRIVMMNMNTIGMRIIVFVICFTSILLFVGFLVLGCIVRILLLFVLPLLFLVVLL